MEKPPEVEYVVYGTKQHLDAMIRKDLGLSEMPLIIPTHEELEPTGTKPCCKCKYYMKTTTLRNEYRECGKFKRETKGCGIDGKQKPSLPNCSDVRWDKSKCNYGREFSWANPLTLVLRWVFK